MIRPAVRNSFTSNEACPSNCDESVKRRLTDGELLPAHRHLSPSEYPYGNNLLWCLAQHESKSKCLWASYMSNSDGLTFDENVIAYAQKDLSCYNCYSCFTLCFCLFVFHVAKNRSWIHQ